MDRLGVHETSYTPSYFDKLLRLFPDQYQTQSKNTNRLDHGSCQVAGDSRCDL